VLNCFDVTTSNYSYILLVFIFAFVRMITRKGKYVPSFLLKRYILKKDCGDIFTIFENNKKIRRFSLRVARRSHLLSVPFYLSLKKKYLSVCSTKKGMEEEYDARACGVCFVCMCVCVCVCIHAKDGV